MNNPVYRSLMKVVIVKRGGEARMEGDQVTAVGLRTIQDDVGQL
jgi:hypothetical protein